MRPVRLIPYFSILLALALPGTSWASAASVETLDLTTSGIGYASLILFGIAYALVMAEEFTQLRKSKPVILAAGIIWAMIASVYASHGFPHSA